MNDVIKKLMAAILFKSLQNGQNEMEHYGYYTNGWPSEKQIDIYFF